MTSVIDYSAAPHQAENLFRKLRKEWFKYNIMKKPREEPTEEEEVERLTYNANALDLFNEETESLLQGITKIAIAPDRIKFDWYNRT